jgi:hypothetical protein
MNEAQTEARDALSERYTAWLDRVLAPGYVFTLADSLAVTEMLQDELDYLDLLIDEPPIDTDFRVTFTYNDDPTKIRMANIDEVAEAFTKAISYD